MSFDCSPVSCCLQALIAVRSARYCVLSIISLTMVRPDVPRSLSRERLNAAEKVTQVLVLSSIEDAGQNFLVKQGISSPNQFVKLLLDSGIKGLQKLAVTVHMPPTGIPLAAGAIPCCATTTATAMNAVCNQGIDIPYMA